MLRTPPRRPARACRRPATGPRRFRLRPGGGITWAKARHESPCGTAATGWEQTPDGLTARITVPGCEAVVELPGCPGDRGPGEHRLDTGGPGTGREGEPAGVTPA
ncbi:alpha-L-rhamnosidase C-terminal domain-containing protein [Streptomyces griseoviridis]|uniref:alpha-L-rhamnosidase C-terminal domain-containing protein n=1 Tax=Streptomyces griseoviridis TaxID=45398 RepID=UPI0019AC8C72|nr:alpha-L-rhamnosidase C-terminal domain-containing protein [Streptomyces griseoviridis]GGT20828.1 hypothetical protein GCM10010240_62090 [Streptomyces griseoviridis]